ncbi:hypothetical protein L0F63_001189, partial [Massospora cicadina]
VLSAVRDQGQSRQSFRIMRKSPAKFPPAPSSPRRPTHPSGLELNTAGQFAQCKMPSNVAPRSRGPGGRALGINFATPASC